MKKIFTLLLLLGMVCTASAWSGVWLQCSGHWDFNDKTYAFSQKTGDNNTWYYFLNNAEVPDGGFNFRFQADNNQYRPDADGTEISSTTGVLPAPSGYAENKSWLLKKHGTPSKILIMLHWNGSAWELSIKQTQTYSVTYYNQANWSWSKVCFYVHFDVCNLTGTDWPGQEVTGTDGWYSASFEAFEDSKVEFNDGSETNKHENKELVINGVYRSHDSSIDLYAINANISSEGYATFSSTKSVNFTGVAGLTAQKGKVNSNGFIDWATAGKLHAGEGVLLSGAAGTYTLTIVNDAVADDTNEFKAIDSKQLLSQSGGGTKTNYILAHPTGNTLGFYKVNENGSWCKAGTAYISSSNGPAAAREFIPIWEEDPTGVDEVLKTENLENGTYYNLAGQQIAKPSRGLYIVNGKKVIR